MSIQDLLQADAELQWVLAVRYQWTELEEALVVYFVQNANVGVSIQDFLRAAQ